MKCEILWIKHPGYADGDSTPHKHDTAIGYVFQEAYTDSANRIIPATRFFPICAEHLQQLLDNRYPHWHFVPMQLYRIIKDCYMDLSSLERAGYLQCDHKLDFCLCHIHVTIESLRNLLNEGTSNSIARKNAR